MIDCLQRRTPMRRLIVTIGFCVVFATGVSDAMAGKPEDITDSEMKLIPQYCPDTMGFGYGDAFYNTSPRASHWVGLMGKGFWAMHHYCWARINVNRAQRAGVPPQRKKGLWEAALGDYKYVINNVPRDFVLLPEVYTRLAEVELLLGQSNRAQEAFAVARKLRPDYWPAYSKWAEFLMNRNNRQEALKVVTAGLEYSPDSTVLLELYRALGGRTRMSEQSHQRGRPEAPLRSEALSEPESGTPSLPNPMQPGS